MNPSQKELIEAARKLFAHRFDSVIEIHLEDGEPFWIDGRQEKPLVVTKAPSDAEPDCTFTSSTETMKRVFDGARALESAFISGRLSIRGDMSVMARLTLEDAHR